MRLTITLVLIAAVAAITSLVVLLLQHRDDLVTARLRLDEVQRTAGELREELGECRTPPPIEPFPLAFVGLRGQEIGLPIPEQRNGSGVLQRQHSRTVGRFQCVFTYRWEPELDGYTVFIDCTGPEGEEFSTFGEVLADSPSSRVGLRQRVDDVLYGITVRRRRRPAGE